MTFCLDEKIEVFGQTIVAKFNISSYNYNCPLCGRYDGGIYDIRQLKILARRHLKKSHGIGNVTNKVSEKQVKIEPKENTMDLTTLTIAEIASIVRKNWNNVYFGAVPYLEAMESLDIVDPKVSYYGCDSGESIVLYFLSNATSFRGDIARAVKKELKNRCK